MELLIQEKGYLTDTCLSAQDKYKAYLDFFQIKYAKHDCWFTDVSGEIFYEFVGSFVGVGETTGTTN